MKGFISISTRAIINVESLSGVETIGNLSRHRTAPIVIPTPTGYEIRFVPVLSGESLAHYYQELLVEEAKTLNIPVSKRSLAGEFLKFSDDDLLKEEGITPPTNENDIRRVEAQIILKDLICDIGGFLYAGKIPVKRTSCFQVGYAIPAIREVEAAALEAQFHMRFAPSSMNKQAPYNVEVGSAVYTFTLTLDLNKIGVVSTQFGAKSQYEDELAKQRENRVKAALRALLEFYSSLAFGAKRSRFLPNIEPISAVASYSTNFDFVTSPGNSKDYVKISKERAEKVLEASKKLDKNVSINVASFDKEEATKNVNITKFDNLESLINWIIDQALAK